MTRENLLRYGKEYLHDLETACCEIGELHLNFVRESIKALEQGLCMDAVSREAVLDEFDKWVNSREKYYEHPVEFARSVMSLPPVTPRKNNNNL